jgi:phosphoribosyl 1,2-cyclic phosphodiesterase
LITLFSFFVLISVSAVCLAATTQKKQIDVGKFFVESALQIYPKHRVAALDAVILTHEHADATFGLDGLS